MGLMQVSLLLVVGVSLVEAQRPGLEKWTQNQNPRPYLQSQGQAFLPPESEMTTEDSQTLVLDWFLQPDPVKFHPRASGQKPPVSQMQTDQKPVEKPKQTPERTPAEQPVPASVHTPAEKPVPVHNPVEKPVQAAVRNPVEKPVQEQAPEQSIGHSPVQTPDNVRTVHWSPEQTAAHGPVQTPDPSPGRGPMQTPDNVHTVDWNPEQAAAHGPVQTPDPSPGRGPVQTPDPSPGRGPVQTPDPSPGQGPVQTPDPSPGRGPVQTPDPSPGQSLGQTPDPSPGQSPGHGPVWIPLQSPVWTPDQTPGSGPVWIPVQSPVQTPDQSPVRGPVQTPDQSPVRGPVQTPDQSPVRGPVQTPDQSPVHGPVQTPDQTPVRGPVWIPDQTPVHGPVWIPIPSPVQTPDHSPVRGPVWIPVQSPVQTAEHGPVQTPDQSTVHGPVWIAFQSPGQSPVQTPDQSTVHGPVWIPIQTPVTGPMQTPDQTPVTGPVQTPDQTPVTGPMQTPDQTPVTGPGQSPGWTPVTGPGQKPVDDAVQQPALTTDLNQPVWHLVQNPVLTNYPVLVPAQTPVQDPLPAPVQSPLPTDVPNTIQVPVQDPVQAPGQSSGQVTLPQLFQSSHQMQAQIPAVPMKLKWHFPKVPVKPQQQPPVQFNLQRPAPANTVAAACGESTVHVEVKQDLFRNGNLVSPSSLTLGGCAAVGQDSSAQVLMFESELQSCGSVLKSTEDELIYTFKLLYNPPLNDAPIIRLRAAGIQIECHYSRKHNVSSNPMRPTWVPYTSTKVAEEHLIFTLKLMTDDWKSERPSNQYFLGEFMKIEASLMQFNHVPLRVFVDSCVATAVPDVKAVPRYSFINNHGCLSDSKISGSSSQFMPRVQSDKLQFQLEVFLLEQNNSSMIYITCVLRGSPASNPTDAENKACSFTANRWAAADNDNQVCSCCDANCSLRKGRSVHADEGLHFEAEASLGPILVMEDDEF